MIGNTNALAAKVLSEGGGTSKIYVENCTSLPIEAGRPVLINMTLSDSNLELSYTHNRSLFWSVLLDNDVFSYGDNLWRYQSGDSQANVILTNSQGVDSCRYFYMNPYTKKLQLVDFIFNSWELSSTTLRQVGYYYLGDGLCIANSKVCRCNEMNGQIGEELYQLPISFHINLPEYGYAYFNKKLFVTNTTSIYQIDLSDLDNIQIIRSATGLNTVEHFRGFTGEEVGDYVLGRAGGHLVMYQLTEDGFTLLEEDHPNRPACLCGLSLGKLNGTFFYNNLTNVLTLLESNFQFRAYSFNPETKIFTEISLPQNIATFTPYKNTEAGLLSISPDRHIIAKSYAIGVSQSRTHIYINSSFDGKLRAYDNDRFSFRSNSLQGFLTGNVDENGRVEVEVITPKQYNLTVEALPEPDVFQINGGIK